MDYRTLQLQIDGPIAHITLARPESANRADARLLRELALACEAIAANDAVRVTLLTAQGADFCAGWAADASPITNQPTGGEATSLPQSPLNADLPLDPFGCLAALPCPVVVALQGAVVSAGLELALACDLRIAAEDARFALPEVSQGTLPSAGGSQRLPRIAGRTVATSMLLLGDELDAQAAYHAGLVSRVFPVADLGAATEALVARIATHGPLALRYGKEAVQHGAELSLDQALRYELDLSVILQTTVDRAEGVRAFMEKRPPNFEGR